MAHTAYNMAPDCKSRQQLRECDGFKVEEWVEVQCSGDLKWFEEHNWGVDAIRSPRRFTSSHHLMVIRSSMLETIEKEYISMGDQVVL